MSILVTELQKINPSSIIELYTLQLDTALHGNNNIYRFHAGTNEIGGNIIWQGEQYSKNPVIANGFEYTGRGQIPRPNFTVSNNLSLITGLMIQVNTVTAGNDLNGSKFTRIRTNAKYLDNANFASGTNPYGTPSNIAHPEQIFYIDRKISENKEAVVFELVSKMDLVNKRLPARQVTRNLFPGVGQYMNG